MATQVNYHDLFKEKKAPLPAILRPRHLSEFIGKDQLFFQYRFLERGPLPSIILWGPPGRGKTTLAQLLAKHHDLEFYAINASTNNLSSLKKIIEQVESQSKDLFSYKKTAAIFIDEIHRFNKIQQDYLLPYVESGQIILIGATTENPKVSINRALISRVQLIYMPKFSTEEIKNILQGAQQKLHVQLPEGLEQSFTQYSDGDARKAIQFLELYLEQYKDEDLSLDELKKHIIKDARSYDKNQDRHYDVISAFIKSMRANNPDSALLWLAVMIDGGEDPIFIARRLVIFASEDVGNADPRAITLATSVLTGIQNIGMPEGRILLGQATTYLASTVKSRRSYESINSALEYVKEHETLEVPFSLRNQRPPKASGREISLDEIPQFYIPSENGQERFFKQRLEQLEKNNENK